jgi:hypothetical protein
MHVYEVRPLKDKRGVDLNGEASIRSAVVRRTERNRERNQLRKVFQPLT